MAPTREMRVEGVGELDLHRFADLDARGVDVAVTSRRGGVSRGPYASLNLAGHVGDDPDDVAENRRRVSAAVGARLVIARQVHGATVVNARDVTDATVADAIILEQTELAVAVLVADCVPLALVNARTHRLAVVHAGWRGLAAGVIAASLSELGEPGDVAAVVGPSISAVAYQVGPEVAAQFDDVTGAVLEDVADRFRLDLRAVALRQLVEAGVHEGEVSLSAEVTDGGSEFFSDRAQRPCGRFAMIAKWSS